MEAKVTFVKTEQAPVFTAGVGLSHVYRVTFMVGDQGPFFEEFKAADFNPTNVKQRTEAIAATVRALY